MSIYEDNKQNIGDTVDTLYSIDREENLTYILTQNSGDSGDTGDTLYLSMIYVPILHRETLPVARATEGRPERAKKLEASR